ncbi:hypothetical protein HBH56_007220 [Parastagonospora nodorum]|uniref:Non-homologous end-joining factor 1 n=2 Tax=Phaeosphaeria nodorum (strain SN15 / ATCC MYA-4574 / FGSC 10173) TaxID=321614 RepID=A0A7U2HSU8_PHANO|nr:hypothetical protein SNOG_00038 [Parastagonospora nodorum SN15]KAH3920615.1 hypothetical protein HBH56_007220 [Parastagonospora nodorum]EAT91533.2 hypothetical protein SNOG_00038 [Parastagonospora nodorum SN15]KAH3922136.1 hypothetical protein HBH54_228560 [Parastagonospora nodorum]KAH4020172.1 hypothetical protein HBI09_181710 [Parastagonospora nodorum]KAH4053231.1 hypothetical protein HBH49_097090 [Parastagonospora nodorum]
MSCWRVLELSELPAGQVVPQLLVKPEFGPDSYSVHLTCLSNIWSEELDLAGIVQRAAEEQSPIEVSKRDTAQLAILLANVKKSLDHSDDTICWITRADSDGITLHTTIALPKPLDSLTWKFHLKKQASFVLKNELILPLLLSSHVQHERVDGLVSIIKDKDRAITRLVDQYESSNLDLAAAFPIISGLKSGRKVVKREQAARHIPALQLFREDAFKQETGQLVHLHVSTLGLFQEALSDCRPTVPPQLKSSDVDVSWWIGIPARISGVKIPAKGRNRQTVSSTKPIKPVAESSGDETEDEFETHSNFKTRNLKAPITSDDATEDDEDPDAPLRSQSQKSSQNARRPPPSRIKSPTPEASSPPKSATPPEPKPKAKGFRIGGKTKEIVTQPQDHLDNLPDGDALPLKESGSSQTIADVDLTPKKGKRTFKIGGKGKGKGDVGGSSQVQDTAPPMVDRTRATRSPSTPPPSSPPVSRFGRIISPVIEEREETAEEKAERRRAELKRKTEEAAKKQAQSKKKRRF